MTNLISADQAYQIFVNDPSIKLTPEQVAAVENASTTSPSLVVAGAGSGKTELMAIRVVWLVANRYCEPHQILGLTFTRKAASELSNRINEALEKLAEKPEWPLAEKTFAAPNITTYNSYANTLYRDYALALGYEDDATLLTDAARYQLAREVVIKYGEAADPRLVDSDLSVNQVVDGVLTLAGAMNDHGVTADEIQAYIDGFVGQIAKLPAHASSKVTPEQPIASGIMGTIGGAIETPLLAKLAELFLEEKRKRGFIDFSDQVSLANRAVRELGDAVRERETGLYTQVLLDEYQDTSTLQNELLAGLFQGKSVLAVGDPNQSIYGWRGASASNLNDFLVDYAKEGQEIVQYQLDRSWRNPKVVLDLANLILAPLKSAPSFMAGRTVPTVDVNPLLAADFAKEGKITVNWDCDVVSEAKYAAKWLSERINDPKNEKVPTAAVLMRTRNMMAVFEHELRAAGLDVEVVGLGGLLEAPEIVDLVAALRVIHLPNSGAHLMRLLAGPRWQIAPKDLQRLSRYARDLARFWNRDSRDVSGAEAESSIIDALDSLLDETDEDIIPRFSAHATESLRDCAELLRRMRSRTGLPLPEFVRAVEQELWLDIELAANPKRKDPMANLNAFANIVSGYAENTNATLGGFLEWLEYADKKERFEPPATKAKAGVVQIITAHTAKGLEWDLVVVPRLVVAKATSPSSFPSVNGTKGWLSLGELPFGLRGDRNSLPEIDLSNCENQTAVVKALDAFMKEDQLEYLLREEQRLAYVAFTRPKSELLLSGSKWKPDLTTALMPSPYLLVAAGMDDDRVEIVNRSMDGESPLPLWSDFETNPLDEIVVQEVWPMEPLGLHHRPKVERAKDAVEQAMATRAPSRAEIDDQIERLLKERDELLHRSHQVKLPVRISASRFKEFIYELPKTAERYRRPMPERPYKQTMAGTLFHSWVEQRFGVLSNSDELDVVELTPEDEATDKAMEELKAIFEGSRFANMKPFAIEGEIQVTIKGNTFICKLDAVFETETGYEIVDWKTGKPPVTSKEIADRALQLALYRMAFARLHKVDPEKIGVCLYYVADNLEIKPEDVPSEADLIALWESVLDQVED